MCQTVRMACNRLFCVGMCLIALLAPACGAQAQDKAAVAEAQIAAKRAAVKAAEAQVEIAKAKLEALKAKMAAAQASESAARTKSLRLKELVKNAAIDVALLDEAEASHQKAAALLRESQAQILVGEAELVRESALREKSLAELAETEARLKQPRQTAQGQKVQIAALLKERHDVLHKVVDLGYARAQNHAGEIAGLTQAERDALQSTLDLFDNPQERMADLEKLEKKAAAIARLAENLAKSGQGRESDALQARAVLLEIQIAVLRERAKIKDRK